MHGESRIERVYNTWACPCVRVIKLLVNKGSSNKKCDSEKILISTEGSTLTLVRVRKRTAELGDHQPNLPSIAKIPPTICESSKPLLDHFHQKEVSSLFLEHLIPTVSFNLIGICISSRSLKKQFQNPALLFFQHFIFHQVFFNSQGLRVIHSWLGHDLSSPLWSCFLNTSEIQVIIFKNTNTQYLSISLNSLYNIYASQHRYVYMSAQAMFLIHSLFTKVCQSFEAFLLCKVSPDKPQGAHSASWFPWFWFPWFPHVCCIYFSSILRYNSLVFEVKL